MLRVLLAPFLVLFVACNATPRSSQEAMEHMQARSRDLIAAEVARDGRRATEFFAEDAVVHSPGAPQIRGRAGVAELYAQLFDTGLIQEFSSRSTIFGLSSWGDLGYETGTSRMVFATPGGNQVDVGKFLAVWERVDGQWLIAALSFNSDTAAPVPVE